MSGRRASKKKPSTLKQRAEKRKKEKQNKSSRQGVLRSLTLMQQKFVERYVIHGNGKQAAIEAGYAPKYADRQASQLLENYRVVKAIEDARTKAVKAAEVKAEDVVREWARIGFVDVRDIFEVNDGGVRIKPSAEWPDDAARAVAEISETVTEAGGSIKLKFHNKLGALDSLGKYLGLLVDRKKVEHTGKDGGPIETNGINLSNLSDEKLATLEKILVDAEDDTEA